MVLIYDGDCTFCRRCALWLEARGTIQVVPNNQANLSGLGLSLLETKISVWWIDSECRQQGHQAIAHALKELGGVWRCVGKVLATPPMSWLGEVVYRWVAANRHRFT